MQPSEQLVTPSKTDVEKTVPVKPTSSGRRSEKVASMFCAVCNEQRWAYQGRCVVCAGIFKD